jgi:hypothetical protein
MIQLRFRTPARLAAPLGALLLVTAATLFLAPGWAMAEGPDRDDLQDQVLTLLREGRPAEALPLCRQYNELFPADPVMLYNQACLENGQGHAAEGAEAFEAAITAGFQEFDYALTDPDLQGAAAPLVAAHVQKETDRLDNLARARAIELTFETWSADLPLSDRTPGDGVLTGLSDPRLRLGWQATGLDIEIKADEDWAGLSSDGVPPPTNGGSGLFISLAVPDGTSSFSSSNQFLFAFGLDKVGGVGAMFIPEQQSWQRIQELDPKIRVDEAGRYYLKAFIPWQTIMPFHPLVDSPLGINAGLFMGGATGPALACLLQTRDLRDPTATTRRTIPLGFDKASVPGEVYLGKISRSISDGDPLGLTLAVLSSERGSGTLTIDFLDGFGRSVLPTGALNEQIDLEPGPNHLIRQADFNALESGSYLIRTELVFPSGHTANWSTSILHLAPEWDDKLVARADGLPTGETETAMFYLDTVREAVARHPNRRSPKAIGKTLTDLVLLLDNAESKGSILPDKGVFLMVYPGPDGSRRICSLYLPGARNLAKSVNPVLVLSPAPGSEGRISSRIGRNYEFGDLKPNIGAEGSLGFPIYLVPRLEALSPGAAPDPMSESAACLAWALEYFQSESASVTGIDGNGSVALQLALEQPGQVNNLMIFAGGNLEPWPQAQPSFIRDQLAPLAAGPPIAWADFVTETGTAGQGRAILEALRELGADIIDVQEIRGGLSLTQAADRTAIWAQDLR